MQDLRKIFRYARPYRRDLFAAVGLIFIECIFEMVIPVLMSTLVDDGVPAHNMAVIFRQGGLMILCAVLALITGLLYARYAARFANGFAAELRMAEYAAVQKFDFANLDRFSDASLVTRMTTDVTVMLNAVNAGLRPLVRSPVMLCMGLAMACVLSPRLTIVFLVTTPILAAVLAWIVTKVGPLYGRQQSAVDHLNGRIQESLTAIRAIKAFVRGGYENAQFDTVNTELSDASTETFRYAVLNLPAFQTVMYTAIVCILWFGGNYILVGTMSVGQLTAFLSYVLQVLNSVMMFSGVFLQMSRSLASARRIREVLTETPDLANAAAPVDTIPDGQIDFDHVSFKYNAKAEKNALSDITLHIPAGATVGIIGGTGAAKTTLVQLIPRLYDATEGTVRVGGRDVRGYDVNALRDAVGIVLQKNLLFSGTIRDNLKWGNPDATDDDLWAACRAAHADEFLSRMPDGLDTDLGQGGCNVSGGQKQRLCIARTLLKHPKVLIFDDSTSAVDTATESGIRHALAGLGSVTKLIIAQRITSVQSADLIVILDDGRLHAVGTHDELLAKDTIYQEIYHSQMKGATQMAKPFGGKRPQDLRHTLRRFMDYLGRHKIMLGVVGLLAAVSALAALLGTYMIRPIVNGVLENGSAAYLAGVVALTAGIYIVGALSTLGYTQLMVRAAQKILQDIRRDLFAHLQTLPLHYFDTNRKGDLMSLFTNDVDTISDALNNSFAVVIQTFIQVAGTLLLLFVLNWRLSLLVVVGYIAMFWYINYSTQRSRAFYARQQASLGELDAYMEEMIAGQKVVKVFNHQQADMAAFAARNEKLREAGTGAQSYAATMIPAVVSIGYLNYAVIAVVGGLMVMWGWSDLGSLASYLVFVRQTTLPINQLTQQGNFLLAALAGAERIFTVMEEKPEIDEGTVELVSVRENSDGTLTECAGSTGRWAWCDRRRPDVPLEPLHGDVRFHDVSFGYTPDRMILQNLSLYAKPGQKIAFVGSTGAGKTTITNLINRFYEVSGGSITYDGMDVRLIKKNDLRRSLGVVLQDTHLFTGTVADNIRFGKLDATQAEIEKAAKIANADSFIRRLPQGYNTMVTSDGANLSQGQRQLLAIARAAVADPPVLILDEATSSIDTRTEALIQKGMDGLMEGRTVFVIAHRLSTVRNADAIIVLEHGHIIERGTHDELLAKKGEYYQLYHGMFELA